MSSEHPKLQTTSKTCKSLHGILSLIKWSVLTLDLLQQFKFFNSNL